MEEVCGYLVLPSLQGYKVMVPQRFRKASMAS